MKKLIISCSFFISNFLFSQYIPDLQLTQNSTNQIKAHLKVYLPAVGNYLSYTTEISGNVIVLNACYYMIGAGAPQDLQNDFYIDIPNGNYSLKVNLFISSDETICDYHSLEDSVTINFTRPIQGVVSLETSEIKKSDLQLFPNPGKDVINIDSSEKYDELKIYDVSGKIALSIQNPGDEINVSKLSNGIYFVELSNDKGKQRKKLIIQK